MNVIIKFLKYFICKWFGTIAVEKIVIILLGELVKRTDSKIDDEIYQEVFKKTETSANEVS
ncbi:hypothetical protein [uncultured Fusobacterium sp.]|uniref:hypothetical protein n=1 Tax=uncultured Fusobacterium sp. TaxID=159267 RepID=UPI0015A72547|nr:hypothetical protein [uncultured Fusobacterium sp.]